MVMVAYLSVVSTDLFAEEASDASAQEVHSADDLSFFDYLGTMVDDNGEWLDPLQLAEQGAMDAIAETAQDPESPAQAEAPEDSQ